MSSASSNLAPGTTCLGSPIGRGNIDQSKSDYCSRFNNLVDVSNRLSVGQCSRNGSSILPGASKIMAPSSNGRALRHFKLTRVLKCVDTEMNTNQTTDTVCSGAGPSDTRSGTPKLFGG